MFLSGIVALTLSPALAAILLKPGTHKKNRFFQWFNRSFDRMVEGYGSSIQLVIRRVFISVALVLALIVASVLLFMRIPSSFLPVEDQGYLFGAVVLPDAASLDRTGDLSKRAEQWFAAQPGVKSVATPDGYSLIDSQNKSNAGTLFITLKSFHERGKGEERRGPDHQGQPRVLHLARGAGDPGQSAVHPRPRHHGRLRVLAAKHRRRHLPASWRRARGPSSPRRASGQELRSVSTTINTRSRQLLVDLDRERAETQGVPVDQVYLGPADHVRLALREPVSEEQPAVPGHPAGRAAVPLAAGRPGQGLRAQHPWRHGADQGGDHVALRGRGGPRHALQQLPGRQDHRRRRAGLQLRAGACRHGGSGRRGAGRGLQLRVERAGVRRRRRPARRPPWCSPSRC